MKVAKINQIQDLADGTTVGEMRVSVKKVFPPKTGEGKFGPWRVQSCILQDSTGEIRGSFWIPTGMEDLQGQMITIKSRSTPKGLQGLSVAHSNHSNSNELKITDKASILTDSELEAEGGSPTPHRAVTSKSPISSGGLTPAEARKALFQAAQLMAEAIKAAAWVGEQVKVTPEQLQAIATSLFISADRAGFAKAFPASAAKPTKETEPEETETDKDEDDLGW